MMPAPSLARPAASGPRGFGVMAKDIEERAAEAEEAYAEAQEVAHEATMAAFEAASAAAKAHSKASKAASKWNKLLGDRELARAASTHQSTAEAWEEVADREDLEGPF